MTSETSSYSTEYSKSADMNNVVKFCCILSFILESLFLCVAKAMTMRAANTIVWYTYDYV